MARRLSGLVIIDGLDHESWPDSDEPLAQQSFPINGWILDENQPAQPFNIQPIRWGGECRVECDVTAKVIGTGQIQISGHARFYEGASEDTDDLEDERYFDFLVPKGGIPLNFPVNLSNWEEGGDYANIHFSLTNSYYEPVESTSMRSGAREESRAKAAASISAPQRRSQLESENARLKRLVADLKRSTNMKKSEGRGRRSA
jgi:hypothetical protein